MLDAEGPWSCTGSPKDLQIANDVYFTSCKTFCRGLTFTSWLKKLLLEKKKNSLLSFTYPTDSLAGSPGAPPAAPSPAVPGTPGWQRRCGLDPGGSGTGACQSREGHSVSGHLMPKPGIPLCLVTPAVREKTVLPQYTTGPPHPGPSVHAQEKGTCPGVGWGRREAAFPTASIPYSWSNS